MLRFHVQIRERHLNSTNYELRRIMESEEAAHLQPLPDDLDLVINVPVSRQNR